MVSITKLTAFAAALGLTTAFDLHRDENGFAILPPTDVVLKSLQNTEKDDSSSHYHVLNSVDSETGEVISVNLNTHETKRTGKFKRDYKNSIYYTFLKPRVIYNDNMQCFNEQEELDVSECTFDFVNYTSPDDCSGAGGSKYSCVLDVEKSQDSSITLKNMDDVPALVRCYHSLNLAKDAKVSGGACGK